eukprot:s77_g27.t1
MGRLASKRKLLPAGRAAKAAAKNRAFKVRHDLQYSGKKQGDAQKGFGPRLRQVEQPSYETIVRLTQAGAKKLLIDAGVLLSNLKKASFMCWSCKTKDALTHQSGFRCQQTGCTARCRVTAPEVSNDQAVHFCRSSEQTLEAAAHRVKLMYPRLRLCLAWTEKVVADGTKYERELVEIDSARMCAKGRRGASAASSSTTNLGRSLVVVGRFARRWAMRGLADRKTARGCGPESREEVSKTVKQSLGRRTILCGDGARAWSGAAASARLEKLIFLEWRTTSASLHLLLACAKLL